MTYADGDFMEIYEHPDLWRRLEKVELIIMADGDFDIWMFVTESRNCGY